MDLHHFFLFTKEAVCNEPKPAGACGGGRTHDLPLKRRLLSQPSSACLVPLPRLELGTEPSQGPVMIRFTTRAWPRPPIEVLDRRGHPDDENFDGRTGWCARWELNPQ